MALLDPVGTTLDITPKVWGVAHYPDGRRAPGGMVCIQGPARGDDGRHGGPLGKT